jgi:hypothetical protein
MHVAQLFHAFLLVKHNQLQIDGAGESAPGPREIDRESEVSRGADGVDSNLW